MMVVIDVDNRQKETYGTLEYPALLNYYLGF